MTNAELLAKIKAEIERRLKKYATDVTMPLEALGKVILELKGILTFISTLESEKPAPNDIEEAAVEYSKKVSDGHNYRDLRVGFIAGAKWQAEKDTRDMCMSDNRHFEKVYQLGKKDMKEQMMKEAVEREVYLYHSYKRDATAIIIDIPNYARIEGKEFVAVKCPNKTSCTKCDIYKLDPPKSMAQSPLCYEYNCGTHKIVDICSRYKCIWKRKRRGTSSK